MCPDRQIISAYLDGEIEAPWDKAVAEHVASCASCRSLYERMAETKRVLRDEPITDVRGPMERVRLQLRKRVRPVLREPAVWARRISLPLPLAALAAALILFFGITLAITQFRPRIGLVRITKAPAGCT